jgi:hypothetical protein
VALLLLLAGALIVGGAILAALGRAGEMAYFPPDASPLELDQQLEPDQLTAADVALLRPPTALWGYSMPATEEALALIARSLSARDMEIASLRRQLAERRNLRPQPGASLTGAGMGGETTGTQDLDSGQFGQVLPGQPGSGLADSGLGGPAQTGAHVTGVGDSYTASSAVDGYLRGAGLVGNGPAARGPDGSGPGPDGSGLAGGDAGGTAPAGTVTGGTVPAGAAPGGTVTGSAGADGAADPGGAVIRSAVISSTGTSSAGTSSAGTSGAGGAGTGGLPDGWSAFRRSGERSAGTEPGDAESGDAQSGKDEPGKDEPGAAGLSRNPGARGARWAFPPHPGPGPHE